MDQIKIGQYIADKRKSQSMTQEQLAEKIGVSRRTISRWETGNNMPDLDVLVELADFYSVDLREILNGERRNECMDQEMKETVLYRWQITVMRKRRGFFAGCTGCLWQAWSDLQLSW